jgi:chromosome segregation ATPase
LEQAVPALLEQAMSNELQLMQAELAASKAQVEHLELEWRIANGAARDASAEIAKLKDEIAKLKDKLRVQAGASAASSDEIAKLKDEIAKLRIKGLRNQLSGAQSSGAPPTERQEENPKSKACVLS